MKTTHLTITAALALATAGFAATPPAQDEHAAHHVACPVAAPMLDSANFDQQIKMMQSMHAKIMAAKTPSERYALLKQQMKAMQNGMAMMAQMRSSISGSMPMGGKMGDMGKSTDKRMTMDHDMMQRHMQMMETMMQMMMDHQQIEDMGMGWMQNAAPPDSPENGPKK